MKRLPVLLLLLFLLLPTTVQANSAQAYSDYLFQFDVYRQNYSDFQVARNEYQKFNTLTAQTAALEATRTMLSQRDLLLRSYLLLLNEKVQESTGLSDIQKGTYQTLIQNEIVFLNDHSTLVEAVGTLDDAEDVSDELGSHYTVLQQTMRQIILGISLGQLEEVRAEFDTAFAAIEQLVDTNRALLTPKKQATIDRWLLQINNKRSLYQQKHDEVAVGSNTISTTSIQQMDRQFTELQAGVTEAKQYLVEGTSFLGELIQALMFED